MAPPNAPVSAPELDQVEVDETTALLPGGHSRHNDNGRAELVAWAHEAWYLTKASVPVILGYMLQNSLQTVSVLMVGRLSPEALSAAAFAYMFAMATAWLVALGGSSALDTLASSSFTRAGGDRTRLGLLLQRGLLVLTGFYAAVVALWWVAEDVFRALGQPADVCQQSARFLRLLAPGGLGYVWFECLKKFLQAQALYRPATYALLLAAPLNALLNYLLIHRLGLGLDGAAVATGLSYWLAFLFLAACAALGRGRECWGGLDLRRAAAHAAPFARLAALGVVHVGTEWWAFEMVALAAGRLGALPLAAQSVLMTADQIINTVPFGLGVAASARLGNLLGAGDPRAARRSAHAAALLSVVLGSALLALLLAARRHLGALFNPDERVVALVADVVPYLALFQIADGLNGSCGGALRGMGRQWLGALVNCLSYYAAALPAGIYLAFHGWGLAGLWMGQCVALSVAGVLEWVIVARSDWTVEVQRSLDRLRDDKGGNGDVAAADEDLLQQ